MIARRLMLVAAVSTVTLGWTGSLAHRALAEDAVAPSIGADSASAQQDIEHPKYQLSGTVSASDVLVRSGPSENTNPIMKLQKGDRIVLIGIQGKWLKIMPPPGCFACISKAWVDRNGDGRTGVVTADTAVHPASEMNQEVPMIAMGSVNQGEHVDIVGEQGQFFRIRPPGNAFVWISKDFVTDVQVLGGQKPKVEQPAAGPLAGQAPLSPADGLTPPVNHSATLIADTQPSTRPVTTVAETPTTQPVALADLETQFMAASKQPLSDQPITQLLAGYRALAKDPALSETQRTAIALRINVLKIRGEAMADLQAMRKTTADAEQRAQADRAEQAEIESRIKANQLTIYTALGTLRPSSLQIGGGTLYRLTDPANGRTVVYLRGDNAKFTGLLGQLIGVKGDVTEDPQLSLKVISPTTVEAVDASKINTGVTAQIMPPSLIAQAAQASAEVHPAP